MIKNVAKIIINDVINDWELTRSSCLAETSVKVWITYSDKTRYQKRTYNEEITNDNWNDIRIALK